MDTTIDKIGQFEGQTVRLKGWIYNKRSSGKIVFLQIRDGFGIIQAVAVKSQFAPEKFEEIQKATQESSIIVTGSVRKDERAPSGYELSLETFEVIGTSEDYPISPKEHGVDFLMEHRHLWLRSARQHAIM